MCFLCGNLMAKNAIFELWPRLRFLKYYKDEKFQARFEVRASSKLNLDDKHIEIGGDVYKLCGDVFTCWGQKLYMINGMLFKECEDIGTDEIMNWDGKCFKRFKLGWEEKLEGDKKELDWLDGLD